MRLSMEEAVEKLKKYEAKEAKERAQNDEDQDQDEPEVKPEATAVDPLAK